MIRFLTFIEGYYFLNKNKAGLLVCQLSVCSLEGILKIRLSLHLIIVHANSKHSAFPQSRRGWYRLTMNETHPSEPTNCQHFSKSYRHTKDRHFHATMRTRIQHYCQEPWELREVLKDVSSKNQHSVQRQQRQNMPTRQL